jgi:hypothetical protein
VEELGHVKKMLILRELQPKVRYGDRDVEVSIPLVF